MTMMDLETVNRLAGLLRARGMEEERSYRLAAEVGDTPLIEGDDLVITESGVPVDRLPLPDGLFGKEQ